MQVGWDGYPVSHWLRIIHRMLVEAGEVAAASGVEGIDDRYAHQYLQIRL